MVNTVQTKRTSSSKLRFELVFFNMAFPNFISSKILFLDWITLVMIMFIVTKTIQNYKEVNLNIIIFIHSLVMCQFTIICVYLCVGKWIVVVYASFHRTFLLRFPFKGSWKGYYMRCIHSPCNLQIKVVIIKLERCDLKCNHENYSMTSNANDKSFN